jgi:microcystin-dependent protein
VEVEMDGYIGQVVLFAGTLLPKNWAYCQGQILSIAQNSALFSIIGNTYGGDGVTTFALPNLSGRAPIGVGTGPGLSPVALGQTGGAESVTLTVSQMPAHTHTAMASSAPANQAGPAGALPAAFGNPNEGLYSTEAPDTSMSASMFGASGGSMAHDNMQPYLGMNYIICLCGVYPSRG